MMSVIRRATRTLIPSVAVALLTVPRTVHAQPTLTDPSLQLQTVVSSGLTQPTTMAFLGANDLLVLQKADGQVIRVIGGAVQTPAVLDVAVNNDSERGLLGIAINTEIPPRVFLYYTEAAVDGGTPLGNRVYRYTWNATTGRLESPLRILDLPVSPGPNHNGGVLLLGPRPAPGPGQIGDGSLLHVVIGDLNNNGQLENFPNGPAPDDTAVILRVQQDGSAAPGNPFVPYCSVTTTQACPNGTGCPAGETCTTRVARYFAYGVRNSFGLAIDPMTGDLWDTENGPNNYDEVNRVLAGFNSGWEQIMGPDSRDPQGLADLFDMPGGASLYSDPEFSWLATIAPTGIIFPVGSALGTAYDDIVLIGDNNTGQLYRLPLNGARTGFDFTGFTGLADLVADSTAERDQLAIGSGFGVITNLVIGPDGALYVVSLSNGAIYRISARSGPSPTATATRTAAPPTATATRSPTRAPTSTQTIAAMFSPSATLRPTHPPTRTRTSTVIATATRTPSPVSTSTPAPSSTVTPTPTLTPTSSAQPTATPTRTPTSSARPTATRTRPPHRPTSTPTVP